MHVDLTAAALFAILFVLGPVHLSLGLNALCGVDGMAGKAREHQLLQVRTGSQLFLQHRSLLY